MVMEQGKVVDTGSHTHLIERCAIYRQLWAQQNRHLDGRGPRPAVAPQLTAGGRAGK
jgi:subfamily B ATP-binding cassette protein HlyB/CyaB